ncbi:DNA-directed RNA polymerase subunit H [Candidatus Bathyarchaeota archaeon]|nr:MAG: DNA-directed RNA polymerase subunit H [Candidatus Bathyarchaeota archaeon]
MEIRGYEEVGSEVLEEPRELKGRKLITAKDKEGSLVLFLCISVSTNVTAKHIEAFRRLLVSRGASRGIVIARSRYVREAKIRARRSKEPKIELIPREFPTFNIFKHEYVPEHRILSPEEAKEVLERYKVKPYQLPWIRASDPAVIAIGAEPGDIIEIKRRSETAGEAVFYRYVVEA